MLQFLIIAGAILIGIVREYKKIAKKNAEAKPAMPVPRTESMAREVHPVPKVKKEVTKKQNHSSSPKAFLAGESAKTSSYTPVVPTEEQVSPAMSTTSYSDSESEYSIQSAEEARKAIIWSEILQRKY